MDNVTLLEDAKGEREFDIVIDFIDGEKTVIHNATSLELIGPCARIVIGKDTAYLVNMETVKMVALK
jgi:hypothetical protein